MEFMEWKRSPLQLERDMEGFRRGHSKPFNRGIPSGFCNSLWGNSVTFQIFHNFHKVVHSVDYASMDDETAAKFVKGKRVTIVGFQKSAMDIAMEAQLQMVSRVTKSSDIFVSNTFQDYMIGSPNEALPLYREIIHLRIPQLAVIGFSEILSNLYTSEMRCRWLAELLYGTFKLA
ncbi:hypothetical protein Ddye_004272 [Dipteronia dyeriana]|uniref:Flavin-containing monooxygenase n=1 Tax=Dipteronia dyeriana TaxID=168575 RepID=A0AAE0CX32_9ROSI|nr:hypothetical protein Ddye_004272 [Dipteronia dyeriana]